MRASEQGVVIIIVGLILTVLLGFAGLAVDFGYFFVQKTRLQATVDAAALACGQKGTCVDGASDSAVPANFAVLAPIQANSSNLVVNVAAPCPDTPTIQTCVKVEATSTWPTFFIKMFGVPTLTTNVSAVALGGSAPTPVTPSPAIFAIGSGGSGSDGVNIVDVQGPVNINADVISNSTKSNGIIGTVPTWPAASVVIKITGDAKTKTLTSPLTNTARFIVTGSRKANQPTVVNPCAFTAPTPPKTTNCDPPECRANIDVPICQKSETEAVIPPGNYQNFLLDVNSANCTVKLSGVYYIHYDAFRITVNANASKVIGENVFFYLNNSSNNVTFKQTHQNAEQISLTASTTAPYAGLLIWANKTGATNFYLSNDKSGNTSSINLGGLVYAPNSDMLFQITQYTGQQTTVSGLYGKSVKILQYSGGAINVNAPASGTCNFDASSGGGSGGGGSGGGGSGATGTSKLVN